MNQTSGNGCVARLKDQLAHSGKLGRFVVRLLDRAHRSRHPR